MLEPCLLAQQEQEKRHSLFIQRYDRLLSWALRLTKQHRPSAEDLVQDAFIQFVLGRTSVEEIENLDGYLRRMLRYMHIARKSRSDQKAADTAISLSDYDSIDLGWSNIDPSRRMQAQQELWQICSYACSRKETARAGAVLILRFFHNYYPTEIAQLLCVSRHAVDQWQNLARKELKQFLNSERGNLRLMNARKHPFTTVQPGQIDSIEDLREIIFASRKGECPSVAEIEAIYLHKTVEITTAYIAHLVSCRRCLDVTNEILQLPSLAERHQSEGGGQSTPPPPASGGSSSDEPPSDPGNRLEKRLRDVVEHKPKQLRVAVNGHIVGTAKVNEADSEFDLRLVHDEQVDFIEVTSEQNIQLLFVIPPSEAKPDGAIWARIELSDARQLILRLEPGKQRSIHVKYIQPPIPDEVPLTAPGQKREPLLSLVRKTESRRVRKTAWFRPLLKLIPARIRRDNTPNQSATERVVPDRSTYEIPVAVFRSRSSRKPLIATFAIVVVAIALLIFFRGKDLKPTLTAQQLLQRVTVAEAVASVDTITRRVVTLEERRDGKVNNFQLEFWQNKAKRQSALRVFDHHHRLIGGVWQTADGKRFVLHDGAIIPEEIAPHSLWNLADVWGLELSASEFNKLASNAVQLSETQDTYVFTYEDPQTTGSAQLVRAILTVRRTDLRAIQLTLVIKNGDEIIEYRFVEQSVEQLRPSEVEPSIFEVERSSGKIAVPRVTPRSTEREVVPNVAPAVEPASPELEIDVADLLAKAKADRAEQLTLTRTPNGSLLIEGVVDSKQRKEEILAALAPVAKNPALTIHVLAVDETAAVQYLRVTEATPANVSSSDETIAVDKELREFLTARNSALKNEALDEAVRSLAAGIVNRSYAIVFRAVELKNLYARLERVDPATVSLATRSKWSRLIHEQATELEREARLLRLDLQPLFFGNVSGNRQLADEQHSTPVYRVHALALECNDIVRAAFTMSSQRSTEVKSQHFLQSLIAVELLSGKIKNAQW